MKIYKYIGVFVLLTIVSASMNAQEQLRPLSSNMNLPAISAPQHSNKKVAATGSMNLPFFEDFSYAYKSPYPTENHWLDSNVYVNDGFAIAPITLGVATFDGLNKKGYPYNLTAPVSVSASADTLTSRPIDLFSITTGTNPPMFYSPADSIALTFYYQAEGFGEAPEPNDSLCLDFFKPLADSLRGVWTKVWGKTGYNPSATDTNFYRVKVFITDTAYFHDGFQFRFRNKATTSGSLDHWHLDYIQIKKGYLYTDTVNYDVAFAYKPSSFLKNYSVIPYRQYNASEQATTFRNYIRNNVDIPVRPLYSYEVKDKLGNIIPSDAYITVNNPGIMPFVTDGYYDCADGVQACPIFTLSPFPLPFVTSDSTYFTIRHTLTNTAEDLQHVNDTLVHIQHFSNYYAYDDGSAEQAYYLNTYGAKTAVRFNLNQADTLKSVRIYFDPVTEGGLIIGSAFRIMVWNVSGSVPGGVVLKDSIMYPQYLSEGYNKIPDYKLTSCLLLPAGSYFIGIQQITNQPLNIGFDRNTNHKNALYYNITGNWNQSSINGSLMINPVLGCVDPPVPVGLQAYEKTDKIKLYPNPAQNSITISLPGNQAATANLEITTALGQTALTKTITSNEAIDISELANGLYFIHLTGNSLNVSPQKLIISR